MSCSKPTYLVALLVVANINNKLQPNYFKTRDPYSALSRLCSYNLLHVLNEEATRTKCTVFELTRTGIETRKYHTRERTQGRLK
jgi:hypothetical protein